MARIAEIDRIDITDILNKVAYILDSKEYDRMGDVFAEDIQFSNPGRLTANGLDELKTAFRNFPAPSLSHHITNLILSGSEDGTVQALCKALSQRADKSIVAAEYTDILKKTSNGWRIASRTIKPL
ncbi:nuclear transport factor 2 family protein [Chelatococcus asaccharovorans]|uniref:SnoaL-like protein n=1 Tax=Chelatococcus asaccharovorans TaxID=28210 RepID=A0A2V3U9J2_9HYPH|nr:nuclear transport factor 2 family protein [Chelatococcus asaccharovorans]MBS7705454.1 nuclear transport factor 2 family protein [Chelatococcus asaccharovorans]PXW60143.1 SnoaL-like protein [Chelatococcus asaccharovorans]